jgi:TPR repeat protein
MKAFFLILIVLLSGCAAWQTKLTPEQLKEKTQKVIENIENKPGWLFPADACPAEIMPAVEKKIEYLSAGCAGNPEKCLEKCRAEDANACYALALFLQEKNGAEDKNTEPLFLRACKLGIVSGCTNRAAAIFNSETEDAAALKCAADTFEKTCSRDDAWGCTMYGAALALGSGREQNSEEALRFLAKACQNSSVENPACKNAKEMESTILKSKKVETNKPKP